MWVGSMLLDNLKAVTPFFQHVRTLKRRLVPYTDNPANSLLALEQGLEQIVMLRAAGARLDGEVLEIGTGWMPIIPLLLHIAGARHVTLADVERLMDDRTLARARTLVSGKVALIADRLGLPEAQVTARLAGPWAYTYTTPWDIAGHPTDSADIAISRAVFEHIDPATLADYLVRLRGIVRPGGMMCHVVDNSDHWEHRDSSISRLNFLRFEDGWFWRFTALNRQNYLNRLRHRDYLAMFRAAGWTVVAEQGDVDPASLRALAGMRLAARFAGYAPEELAILTSWFVLRRPA